MRWIPSSLSTSRNQSALLSAGSLTSVTTALGQFDDWYLYTFYLVTLVFFALHQSDGAEPAVHRSRISGWNLALLSFFPGFSWMEWRRKPLVSRRCRFRSGTELSGDRLCCTCWSYFPSQALDFRWMERELENGRKR